MGIIIPIAITLLYGFLGYKLKKNYILWGLMGLGILMGPFLLVLLSNFIFSDHLLVLGFWPLALLAGPLFSLIIAGIVAYRNNVIFKGRTIAENSNSEKS